MKILHWIAWISAAIGAVFILFGLIAIIDQEELFLGIRQIINYFHAANSFLLIAIALFIGTKKCECKNDK
jgi:hypothetical protein